MTKMNLETEQAHKIQLFIDADIWNETNLKEWNSVFYDIADIEELAVAVGSCIINNSEGMTVEGFGIIPKKEKNGEWAWWVKNIDPNKLTKGIYYVDLEEYYEAVTIESIETVIIKEKEVGNG